MPQVTEQHRAARGAEILAAACRCFARDGFHATSIADIIRDSGLSAGSVYLYFKSKNEIIAAVVEMTLGTADELSRPTPLRRHDAHTRGDRRLHARRGHLRAVNHPVLRVDMSRVALHAWAEALRDPEIADRIEQTLGTCANTTRTSPAAGKPPAPSTPTPTPNRSAPSSSASSTPSPYSGSSSRARPHAIPLRSTRIARRRGDETFRCLFHGAEGTARSVAVQPSPRRSPRPDRQDVTAPR